jgi:ketosteroid isomerase-like protein
MRQIAQKFGRSFRMGSIAALALLAIALPAGAQKKNKNTPPPPPDIGEDLQSAMRTPDGQAIDQTIGEALGYWQIGDVESLHKYYAEDVVLVSGVWEPPVIGWDNFLKAYKAQRAQVNSARMDRSNTLIKVNGNTAWATYQFIYVAQTEGKVAEYRGHTTVFLIKQANRWVITLNHSSIADSAIQAAPTPPGSAKPGEH